MQPSKGTAKPRPILGAAAYQVMTDAPISGFIGSVLMPYFDVSENAGIYPVIPAKALFNVPETARSERGNYSRSVEQFESGQFVTRENGHEMPVDERFAKIYRTMLELETFTSRLCMEKILRAQEVRVAARVFNASNYQTAAASAHWDNPDTDVKKDLDAGIEIMRKKGIQPNALVMSWWLYRKLTNNKLVLAAVKDLFPEASKTGTVTQAMIEAYFDIRLIVAGALHNTANRAKAAKLEDIWSSEYAMLARVATPGADITEPCIGRIMRWNEGLAGEVITDTYWEDSVRASVVRHRHDTQEVLLQSIDENTGAAKSRISYHAGLLFTGVKTG